MVAVPEYLVVPYVPDPCFCFAVGSCRPRAGPGKDAGTAQRAALATLRRRDEFKRLKLVLRKMFRRDSAR
jgi:hypothetical protein